MFLFHNPCFIKNKYITFGKDRFKNFRNTPIFCTLQQKERRNCLIAMETNLRNKVICVAGSSKGLGFGIAKQAALDGAHVSIASRNIENIDKAIEELNPIAKGKVKGYILDASKSHSIKGWISETLNDFGSIYGLVTNAGGPPAGMFEDFDDKQWHDAFELTLMSNVRMIREVLPIMKSNKEGSILTVTSSSVKEPIDILLLSNVMRSGVVSLAKSLSFYLAKHNIRINNLVPGRFDTDRVKQLDSFKASKLGTSKEIVKSSFEKAIPLGRYGHIDEFGKAAIFLLSDAATYITGETLIIDGGSMRTVW